MNQLNLDLSVLEAENIVSFLGYGHLSAPVWFIGLEEGLGKMSDEDNVKNLKARGSFENVMDLHEAHLRLQEGGRPMNIEMNSPSTQVWQFMAKIMLARDGHTNWTDKLAVKTYISQKLGRGSGDTFMTELSPIPTSRNSDKRWKAALEERLDSFSVNIKDREDHLKRTFTERSSKPLVICFGGGKKQSEDFARLLNVQWRPVGTKIRVSTDSRCLLLPFFGYGHMSHAVIEELLQYGLLND